MCSEPRGGGPAGPGVPLWAAGGLRSPFGGSICGGGLKINLAQVDIGPDNGNHDAVAQGPLFARNGVGQADALGQQGPVAVRLATGTKPSTPLSSSTKTPFWVTPEMVPSRCSPMWARAYSAL